MGSITKKLVKIRGIKGGPGFLYLQTYRESFRLSFQDDQVIVQLNKAFFQTDTPEEITVTIEWPDRSD